MIHPPLETDREKAIFEAGIEEGMARAVAGLLLRELQFDALLGAADVEVDHDGMQLLRRAPKDAPEGGATDAAGPS